MDWWMLVLGIVFLFFSLWGAYLYGEGRKEIQSVSSRILFVVAVLLTIVCLTGSAYDHGFGHAADPVDGHISTVLRVVEVIDCESGRVANVVVRDGAGVDDTLRFVRCVVAEGTQFQPVDFIALKGGLMEVVGHATPPAPIEAEVSDGIPEEVSSAEPST